MDLKVSRHTPILSFNSTLSIISLNSSKLLPISVPFPAIVSSSTVVVCSGFRALLIISDIYSMPTSTPCFTWLPGWKLYKLFGTFCNLLKSSSKVCIANSLLLSSAAQAFKVYGAWANNLANLFSSANFRNACISLLVTQGEEKRKI